MQSLFADIKYCSSSLGTDTISPPPYDIKTQQNITAANRKDFATIQDEGNASAKKEKSAEYLEIQEDIRSYETTNEADFDRNPA
jgi:hypothetical protein